MFGGHVARGSKILALFVGLLEGEKRVAVVGSAGPLGQRIESSVRAAFVFARGFGFTFLNEFGVEVESARGGFVVVVVVDSDAAPEFFFSFSELGKFELWLCGAPPPAQSTSYRGYAYAIDVIGHEAFDAAAKYRRDRLDS